jgi:thioredoxin-like negative regulator of GroEL
MGTWVFFVVRGLRELPLLITPRQVSAEPDRFCEARQAYLTSDWTTAEALLGGILAIESRDPSALLLMCGVYRHTNRVAEAQELLDEIKKMEVADAWWLEVRAESMRIERQLSSESANPADDVNPETIEESRMEVSTVETGAENLV